MKKTVEDLEFGYSHENAVSAETGSYYPIRTLISETQWFPTLDEAERAMNNDLRWVPRTFIICRPKPELPVPFVAEDYAVEKGL